MSDDESRGFFGQEPGAKDRIRIKICGITSAADAQAAIDAGADALGFNFSRGSSRYIDILAARDWMAGLPATVRKVAVLVNPTMDEAMKVADLDVVDALQLHGDEVASFCRTLAENGIAFAKAIGVRDGNSLLGAPSFFTDTILLDSRAKIFGGSGEIFPWRIARNFVKEHSELRIILAGGLTPDNVAEAINQVRPFAVDVASGVELSPGRKDPARLRAFISAARR